jgi:hypothetical protein
MICDRTMDGRPLPENMKIIGACNPYRLRMAKSLYGVSTMKMMFMMVRGR